MAVPKATINKDAVTLYDGTHFPFTDKSFDTSLAVFVLHHTTDPIAVLKEMKRTSDRVILFEETYKGLFSKLDLVYRDIYVSLFSGQSSEVHWGSYFSTDTLHQLLRDQGFTIVHHQKEARRRYFKELFVLE